MALVELGITILMEDTEAERLRKAFARRLKNPDATLGDVLAMLKQSAIGQIGNVVLEEERAALEEAKAALPRPVMS